MNDHRLADRIIAGQGKAEAVAGNSAAGRASSSCSRAVCILVPRRK